MRRSPVHVVVAVAYLAALAAIAFWPTPVDRGVDVINSWPVRFMDSVLGIAPLTGYDIVQTSANVVLFLPLGWLAIALTRLRWWQVTLAGFLLSTGIELGQAWLRPERVAAVSDVVANTSGAAVGALLASLLLHRRERVAVGSGA
jgi:glycopeptide antibiotics resistance protein